MSVFVMSPRTRRSQTIVRLPPVAVTGSLTPATDARLHRRQTRGSPVGDTEGERQLEAGARTIRLSRGDSVRLAQELDRVGPAGARGSDAELEQEGRGARQRVALALRALEKLDRDLRCSACQRGASGVPQQLHRRRSTGGVAEQQVRRDRAGVAATAPEQLGCARMQARSLRTRNLLVDRASHQRVDQPQGLHRFVRLQDLHVHECVRQCCCRGTVESRKPRGRLEIPEISQNGNRAYELSSLGPRRPTRRTIAAATRSEAMLPTAAGSRLSAGAPHSWCSSSVSRNGLPRVAA